MKKFLISCGLFFLLIAGCFLLIDWLRRAANQSDYLHGIVVKHQRIDSIHTPKIIFDGGSNLAFGIDSKSIQDSLGMPVVNMGLHAGLGLEFMLKELKYSVKENDIVFLSVEYFLKTPGTFGLHLLAKRDYPPAANFYTVRPMEAIDYYIGHNRRNLKALLTRSSDLPEEEKEGDTVYNSKAFNRYGDVVSHLDKEHHTVLYGKEVFSEAHWEGIELINNFIEYAKSKHVTVFYLFPNYPVSEYQNNKAAIDHLEADLKSHLAAPVINSPSDFLFPDSLFFDTVYHLTGPGRRQRTDRLIQILKRNPLVQRSIQSSLAFQAH